MADIQESTVIVDVKNLKKYYPIQKRLSAGKAKDFVHAVDDVSFSVLKGEAFGLVGESGCGKTTTARLIARAIEPTEGEIWLHRGAVPVDLAALNEKKLRPVRRDIQMIFQDPYSSLSPRMSVYNIIAEPLICAGYSKHDCKQRVAEMLSLVGLNPEYMVRYPHAFSGGQRQRIGIARALALNPALILADEPVSALDVSVQAQVLNLIVDLKNELGLTCIYIGHDLSVIRYICNRIAVMYMGKIVELGVTEQLFMQPRHPYTKTLLDAVPDADPNQAWKGASSVGEVSTNKGDSVGCQFASRCKYACEQCGRQQPLLAQTEPGSGRYVACHRWKDIRLEDE